MNIQVLVLRVCCLTLTLLLPAAALAQDSSYWVVYGGPGTPGRVYDSQSNTTTYTYTVIGKGSEPEEYSNKRLKAFKLSECVQGPISISQSPDLVESDLPEFFEGANPDNISAALDPVGFNFSGWLWKGWRGDGTLPALLNVDEQRTFSLTYEGDLPEGPIVAGTALISNATGGWSPAYYTVPGNACESTCQNRIVVDFDDLQPGSVLTSQLSALGITVTTVNGTAGQPDQALVVDSSNPATACSDLGTPNTFYGGPGLPSLDAASGAGIGNGGSLGNVLVVPNNTAAPACTVGAGTIEFSLSQPAQLLALSFVDLDEDGARVSGMNAGNLTVFSELISPTGDNSVVTTPFGHLNSVETTKITVELFEGAALDALVLCADGGNATPTPSPSPSSTPTTSPSASPSTTPTGSPTPTLTPTNSPSGTPQPSPTPTDSPGGTPGTTVTPEPSPTLPPSCLQGDISEQQHALDGYTTELARVVKKTARRLKRLSDNRGDKKFSRRARKRAIALGLSAWEVTWSMQSQYLQCTSVISDCVVSSDYQQKTAIVLQHSQDLLTLSKKLLKRLTRVRDGNLTRSDKRIEQQATELFAATQKEIELIPAETVSCSSTPAAA